MKILLSLLGALTITSSTSLTVISCGPKWNNDKDEEGTEGNENNKYDPCNVIAIVDENLKKEDYWKLDVKGSAIEEWSCISKNYSKEIFELEEQIQNEILKYQINEILIQKLESLQSWYEFIVDEAQYYMALDNMGIDISNDKSIQEGILNITTESDLLNLKYYIQQMIDQIKNFKTIQEKYWKLMIGQYQSISFPTEEEKSLFKLEESQWDYLVSKVMKEKLDKYQKLLIEIEKIQ